MPSLKTVIIAVIIAVLLAITARYYQFEFERIGQIREAIVKSEAVLKQKQEVVRDYKEKVAFYKTEEGAAHLAREQYNLVGKGEQVILLKSPDEQPEY